MRAYLIASLVVTFALGGGLVGELIAQPNTSTTNKKETRVSVVEDPECAKTVIDMISTINDQSELINGLVDTLWETPLDVIEAMRRNPKPPTMNKISAPHQIPGTNKEPALLENY